MTRTRIKGHSIKSICKYVGISRQAYYQRLAAHDDKSVIYQKAEGIVSNNRRQKARSGLRTIWHKEQLQSLLGLNQFEKEMSLRGYALKPYRSYMKTTDSRGYHYKFDNLISGIELTGENQVIVGDITYYQSNNSRYYIFHFVDYYTKELKGLVGSDNMEGIHAEKCLRQVFKYNNQKDYNHTLILHTDGGSQYRSHKFQKALRDAKIRPSHAHNCFENGLSERQNGIIKNEYLIDYDIRNVGHLNIVLKKIKDDINKVWPSKELGYRTPQQYLAHIHSLPKSKRPIKPVKIVEKNQGVLEGINNKKSLYL